MTSGLAPPRTPGAITHPVAGFSVTVIVYRRELPVRTPDGMRMAQARSWRAAAQAQLTVTAEMPGPRSLARTPWAAASALASGPAIALPLALVSRNRTAIAR